MAVSELFVVEAEQVQDRGVEVVHMNFVLGDLNAVIVRTAVANAGSDAGAGHPRTKHGRMMLAAFIFGIGHKGSASKFSSPNDQGIVQHAARFEIFEQRSYGLIDIARKVAMIGHVAVRIPIAG